MTVILAVEPDPSQASRLSAVLRRRQNTEVVIAKSADAAIQSIAGRVPDVLLTSQLLAPQDETRLANWLQELGSSAARIHALTIPILAPKAIKEQPKRGLLAGLRRRPKNAGSHGCEPTMFAKHVAAYLDQGLADRLDEVPPEVHAAASAVAQQEPVLPEPSIPEPAALEAAVAEHTALTPMQPEDVFDEVFVAESAQSENVAAEVLVAEPAPTEEFVAEVFIAELAQPALVLTEAFVAEPAEPMVAAPVASYDDDEGLWLLTRSPQVIEFSDEPPSREPDALPLGILPPSPTLTLPRELRPVASFEVVFELPQVVTVNDDSFDTGTLGDPLTDTTASMLSADPATDSTPPLQDEWGFFDPSKCGFAALLDKLDEIADAARQSTADAEAAVRIVTHY